MRVFIKPFLCLIALFTLVMAILFIYLALYGYVADSEIWSITLAKNIREEWLHPWVFTRPLFYGSLAAAEYFFNSAIPIFMAAKTVALMNAIAIMVLTYRLARTLAGSNTPLAPIIPWTAVFLLLVNTGFLNQGYRIRSDLFACALWLFTLEIFFRARTKLTIRSGIIWLLPLLATPKALVHVLPTLLLIHNSRSKTYAISLLAFFFLLVAGLYPTGLVYFFNTFYTPTPGFSFFSEVRFAYVERILTGNIIILTFFVARVFTFSLRAKRGGFSTKLESWQQKTFALLLLVSIGIVVFSPDKVPFYLAAFLPIISVFTALILGDIWELCAQIKPSNRTALYQKTSLACFGFCFLILMAKGVSDWSDYKENNSAEIQFTLIDRLEKHLNEFPLATYYDVVGLVPQRATLRYFVGPSDSYTNSISLGVLQTTPPNLIYYVRKFLYLEPLISDFLSVKYFPIANGIFARWEKFPKPLPINSSNKKEILAALTAATKAVGRSSVPNFSALIKKGKSAPIIQQVTEKELFDPMVVGKQSELLAISPFVPIEPRLPYLHNLIRFDWE